MKRQTQFSAKLMMSAASLTLAIAITPAAVWAQAASADPSAATAGQPQEIDEVIVTAQRRTQNVQVVPVAVSVASARDLERLQANNLSALQYSTPSLVVAGSDPTRQRFGIRGVSDQSRNAGVDNRIGVYVDGVWVGRSAASNQDALDVRSVEILRGPQGTLFGKNTVAGAISITTQRPELGSRNGLVEVEGGNYNLQRARGYFNFSPTENVAVRLSGGFLERDGFTENLFNKLDYDNRSDRNLRGQFLYQNDDTTLYFTVDSSKQEMRSLASGERVVDSLAPSPRQVQLNDPQDLVIEYDGVSGQYERKLASGGTFTSISAYRTSEYGGSSDEDFSPANVARTIQFGEETEHFSQEFRYASPTSDVFDYVVGAYYLDQNLKSNGSAEVFARALNPAAPPVFVGVSQTGAVDANSVAVFAHGNYRFTPALQLTVGGRLNYEKKKINFQIRDTSTLFTTGTLVDDLSSTDFSPTISLNYTLNKDMMTYARYSRGYKAGGWNADFVRSINDIAFKDESVDAYEVGLKSMLFARRLRLNVAAYHSSHSNYQVFAFVQLSNGGTALNVTNAGELSSQGFEIESELLVTKWLTLHANYGYNDASFDSFKNGGGPGINFDGNRPAEAPKHNLNLAFEMEFPLQSAQLLLQGDYNYRSSFYSNPDNLPINLNGALETINFRAGLEFDKFSVFAWIKNAGNETAQIFNGRSFLGIARARFNDPQTFGLMVKVPFGS